MSNPYDETEQNDQRPQPRYGAYAPHNEGAGEQAGKPSDQHSETGGQHNPYGEPTWGQPSPGYGTDTSGQPDPYPSPDYGDHQPGTAASSWQQPGQAGATGPGAYPGAAPTQKPRRPLTLVLAMILMLAAAALSLTWGIYVMVTMQAQDANELMSEQMREAMINSFQSQPELQEASPEEALEMALLGLGVLAVVWAVFLLAVYVTLAFVGTMTGNAGRVIATIWLAASALFLLLGHDGGSYLIIVLTVVASLSALVLLWLPASNEYVKQRRAYKEAQRRAPYSGQPPGFGGGQPPQSGGYQPGSGAGQGPGIQNPYGGPHT